MKNETSEHGSERSLLLVGLTTLFLLLLHFLPTIHIGGMEMREVSILSDLTEMEKKEGEAKEGKEAQTSTASALAAEKKWPDASQPIVDYSDGQEGGMAHFYAMLDSLDQGKLTGRPLRIAIFADSYTEGDILAADLREMLQAKHGGNGVGWIDLGNSTNRSRLSLSIKEQGLTECMAMEKDAYDARRASPAARYTPMSGNASITVKGYSTYPHASTWQVVRTYVSPSISVALKDASGSTAQSAKSSVKEVACNLAAPVGLNTVSLAGTGTAYGVSLEGRTGIVVDNFSMRSSSGLPLGEVPDAMLSQFQALRQYDLVIIAYGGNVASNTGKADECEWYVKSMGKVIEKMRRGFAPASILVFSTPDKGARKGNGIGTSDAVKGLVAYQEQMARDCHVAFYDLLAAMGGEGSAGRLRDQDMVRTDLFHINEKGGAYVAERIFNSLEAGVKFYKK